MAHWGMGCESADSTWTGLGLDAEAAVLTRPGKADGPCTGDAWGVARAQQTLYSALPILASMSRLVLGKEIAFC